MSNIDERIEVLINRRLDGELAPDEGQELDEALIQNQDARVLLDDYQRLDDLAGQVLQGAFADSTRVAELPTTSSRRRSMDRAWWALPFVAAAALVLLVVFSDQNKSGSQIVGSEDSVITMPTTNSEHGVTLQDGPGEIRQAAAISDSVDRTANTNSLYIIGNDGQLYVIEQQRLRTARVPKSGIRRVSGDF